MMMTLRLYNIFCSKATSTHLGLNLPNRMNLKLQTAIQILLHQGEFYNHNINTVTQE